MLGLSLAPRARLAPTVWPALLATVVVACCVPRWLLNVWGSDFRLPLVAAIVLIGAVTRGPRLGRHLALGVLALVGLWVLIRAVDAFVTLRGLDAQVAQVRQVVATLPVGTRLLVVEPNELGASEATPLRVAPAEMTGHIGLVATIDRDAFVPFLFTGLSAVQLRPEVRRAASPNAMAVTADQLRKGFATHDPPEGPPASPEGGTGIGWDGPANSTMSW